MRHALPLAVILAAFLPARAADLHVDADGHGKYPTIQAAMDAAEAGDRVLLSAGVFRDVVERSVTDDESLRAIAFLRPGVTLEGAGSGATFLDGEEDHRGLVGVKLDKYTELRGFTLLHCDAEGDGDARGESLASRGGGILLLESSPVIEDLRFVGCNAWGGGAGLYVSGSDGEEPIFVQRCGFVYCYSRASGGGIEMRKAHSAIVSHNTFAGNFADVTGGAIALFWSPGDLSNNLLWYNCSHEGGGALWCRDGNVSGSCNLFWDNFPEATEPDGCGVDPGENGNLLSPPRFCDVDGEDYTIDKASAAAAGNSGPCGLIGAYGVACGDERHLVRDLGVREARRDLDHGLRVTITPNPSRGDVHLTIEAPREESGPLAAEVLDVRGRKITELRGGVDAGRGTLAWDGRDDSGAGVGSGIYLARVRCGDEVCTVRIILLR